MYTPKQYAELITRASKLNKFSVKMIDATDTLFFKSWWPKKYLKNRNFDETFLKKHPEKSKSSKYRNFSSLTTNRPMWGKYKQGNG